MINLRNVLILMRHDIRLSTKNGTVLFLVAMPLVLSLIMRIVIGGAPAQPKMAIVGVSESEFRNFIVQSGLFRVEDRYTDLQAQNALEKGEIDALLILPGDVDVQLAAGATPQVTLLVDEARQTQAAMARYLMNELGRSYVNQTVPITLTVEQIRGITREQGMLPNWVAMILAMGIIILPTLLTQEKQTRTLDALMVTPLSYLDIIMGKSLYGILVVCIGAVAILAINGGLIGNVLLLILIMLLGSASTVGIGLFIGLLVDTPETAGSVSSVVLIPVIWSAFFADVEGTVGQVSALLPGYHISQSMLHVMFTHGTIASEWGHMSVLAGFAALAGLACLWALSRREV